MAFDDFIPSLSPVYTNESLNAALGRYDLLGWQVVIDNWSGSGALTFDVQIEHAADDKKSSFLAKSRHATGSGSSSAVGEMHLTGLTSGDLVSRYGYDSNVYTGSWGDSPMPSLAFVRLKMWFGGSSASGHVRLWVTARDRGHPAKKMHLNLGGLMKGHS